MHQKWILDEEEDVGVCVGWNFENRCYAEKNEKFSKIFYLKFWYLASLTCLKTMKDFRKNNLRKCPKLLIFDVRVILMLNKMA